LPSNLPVKAGLSVSGEAKNWEKCGSWAFTTFKQQISRRVRNIVLITVIKVSNLVKFTAVLYRK
jgi:hypothetical protein